MLAVKTWRKRQPKEQKYKQPESYQLIEIRDLFQAGQTPEALQLVDQKLATETRPYVQAQFLSMAADSQMRLGKFADAIKIYQKAAQLNADHFCQWIRPRYGMVQALLKDVRVNEAVTEAKAIWAKAVDLDLKYEQQLAQARATLQSQGQTVILPRPPRRSVVASQLGQMFLSEGEIAVAKDFYQKAIENNPAGGCRARQGLALIALREGDLAVAEQRATEALVVGKYQAKTVSAWKLLIEARQRQDKKGAPAEHLEALAKIKKAAIRSRSILELVKTLRAYDDSAWKTIAQAWLQVEGEQYPIITAELRKLFLTETKLQKSDSQTQVEAAKQLLNTPNLSAIEYLAASKQWVAASLNVNPSLNLNPVIEGATQKYGADFTGRLAHALALVCLSKERRDLARSLLQQNVSTLQKTTQQWRKSLWALAQLASKETQPGYAAQLYLQYYQQAPTSAPERFRLSALIAFAAEAVAAGQFEQMADTEPLLLQAVEKIDDWELLLDMARKMDVGGARLEEATTTYFNKGVKKAWEAFKQTTQPVTAIAILAKLVQRFNDFEKQQEILDTWQSLSSTQRQWLWMDHANYWQYVGFVLNAYRHLKRYTEGKAFALSILNDSATSLEGFARIGALYGALLLEDGNISEAFNWFEKVVQRTPIHEYASFAHYWLALRDYKKGNKSTAFQRALQVKRCLGDYSKLTWHGEMLIKAELLLADLNINQIPFNSLKYNREQVSSYLPALNSDLEKI